MNSTCEMSPTGEHEFKEGIPGISGNTYFECKYCGEGEIDD